MSKSNVYSNKQEFIKHLELIRDLEAEKPAEEMDVSLVKTCVELILEMRGENIYLSTEEVKEKVRNIPFVEETTTLNTPPKSVKGRSTKVKSRKILLIAAIISILVAIFALTSIAFEWNIFDELKERFGAVANSPVDEEIDVNGISVYMYGEPKVYDSVENAMKEEGIEVLYPSNLPNEIIITEILLHQKNQIDNLVFNFNNENISYSVLLNQILSDDIKSRADEVIEINQLKCYFIEMDDIGILQIYFEKDGNMYEISYTDKETLIEMIENLKESK